MKRTFSTVVVACVLAGVFAVSVFADEFVFLSPIFGSNPDNTIAGVASGGAPWVVKHGVGILMDDGRVRVDVRGLVLPSVNNTPGPVTQVSSSVVCSDAVAATSGAVALSAEGNAEIRTKLTLPSPCFGTVILVRVAGTNGTLLTAPGPWIAATGVAKDPEQDQGN
jgi:hypothetical protein